MEKWGNWLQEKEEVHLSPMEGVGRHTHFVFLERENVFCLNLSLLSAQKVDYGHSDGDVGVVGVDLEHILCVVLDHRAHHLRNHSQGDDVHGEEVHGSDDHENGVHGDDDHEDGVYGDGDHEDAVHHDGDHGDGVHGDGDHGNDAHWNYDVEGVHRPPQYKDDIPIGMVVCLLQEVGLQVYVICGVYDDCGVQQVCQHENAPAHQSGNDGLEGGGHH